MSTSNSLGFTILAKILYFQGLLSFSSGHFVVSSVIILPAVLNACKTRELKEKILTEGTELLGLRTFPIVRYSRIIEKIACRKLDLFPSSGEGEDTYSIVSVRKS
jgi:hypothetical protein